MRHARRHQPVTSSVVACWSPWSPEVRDHLLVLVALRLHLLVLACAGAQVAHAYASCGGCHSSWQLLLAMCCLARSQTQRIHYISAPH